MPPDGGEEQSGAQPLRSNPEPNPKHNLRLLLSLFLLLLLLANGKVVSPCLLTVPFFLGRSSRAGGRSVSPTRCGARGDRPPSAPLLDGIAIASPPLSYLMLSILCVRVVRCILL